MPKGKRGKSRQYRERLQFQLRYMVDRDLYPTREDADDVIARAREYFLESGEELHGVKIEGRWRNPDNKNPKHANWKSTKDKGQSLFDFWKTLGKGRGALR